MEWVACKSPMPLQAPVLYIFSCVCNGILPGFNAVTALCLKYWLITRVGKFQWHFHFSLASEKAFSCIFHGNLLCHCKYIYIYNGIHFSIINVLMTMGKT